MFVTLSWCVMLGAILEFESLYLELRENNIWVQLQCTIFLPLESSNQYINYYILYVVNNSLCNIDYVSVFALSLGCPLNSQMIQVQWDRSEYPLGICENSCNIPKSRIFESMCIHHHSCSTWAIFDGCHSFFIKIYRFRIEYARAHAPYSYSNRPVVCCKSMESTLLFIGEK